MSSSALRSRTLLALADECKLRGITHLELTSSFPFYEGIPDQMLAAAKQGLQLLLHNYFPPAREGFVINLASSDARIRERSLDHCRQALALSAAVGAPFFSVHAGFAVDPDPRHLGVELHPAGRVGKAEALRIFHDAVAELCEAAGQHAVGLLIENNVVSRRNVVNGRNEMLLGVNSDDFAALFDAVRHPALGIMLDVAHLKVSARTLGFDRLRVLEELPDRVRAVHVSDNDGITDNNQPFDCDAWFVPHLSRFTNAVFVIETRPVDALTMAQCLSVLENI